MKLCDRIPLNKINSSGIYKLQCKTCNKSYVGQTVGSIEIRHREHTRYIQTNDPISAYALHMLNNRHEYGNPDIKTIQLLRACSKGKKMNCWESFYIQVLQQHKLLIDEQKVNEPSPIYSLANITRQHVTQPRYPLRLSTRQTSTLTTSTRGKSVIQYIQYVHDIISIYLYNNVHIYCRMCMQPQIHTACTRYYNFEQIMLYR